MKYKAGESVRVKSGLSGMYTRVVCITDEMKEKEGKTVVVTAVDPQDKTYKVDWMQSWFEEEMLEPVEQFSSGGIVPLSKIGGEIVNVNDWERYMPVIDFNEAYKKMILSCGTISLTLSNARKNKSGIESRKEIRKRLLKL